MLIIFETNDFSDRVTQCQILLTMLPVNCNNFAVKIAPDKTNTLAILRLKWFRNFGYHIKNMRNMLTVHCLYYPFVCSKMLCTKKPSIFKQNENFSKS